MTRGWSLWGKVNPFLGTLGVMLLIVASIGLFLDRSEPLSGSFLIAGSALCIFAVLLPRLDGSQQLGLTGAKFNLAAVRQLVEIGEIEIETQTLTEIEELL